MRALFWGVSIHLLIWHNFNISIEVPEYLVLIVVGDMSTKKVALAGKGSKSWGSQRWQILPCLSSTKGQILRQNFDRCLRYQIQWFKAVRYPGIWNQHRSMIWCVMFIANWKHCSRTSHLLIPKLRVNDKCILENASTFLRLISMLLLFFYVAF